MDKSIVSLIEKRRRQILIHSYIYYRLGESIISDYEWTMAAMQLAHLQRKFPKESKKAQYYEGFIGFDGSSGFDLHYDKPEIERDAHCLLRFHKEGPEYFIGIYENLVKAYLYYSDVPKEYDDEWNDKEG